MDETTKSPEKSKNGPEKVRIQQKGSVYRHYSSLGPEVRNVKFCIGLNTMVDHFQGYTWLLCNATKVD